MIYTGNYKNCSSSNLFVSISKDQEKNANFVGPYYKPLAPKLSFLKEWQSNIGKVSEEENMKFYIENYYNQVLKNLDLQDLFETLGNTFILGCYEEEKFCHRYIVASYLELVLGIEIPEVKVVGKNIIRMQKSDIMKKVNNILCDVIINDIDNNKYHKVKTMSLL